jgi:hypothetical protein
MAKWIEFIEIEPKPKTRVYEVRNKENQTLLGHIKFYAPFRKYSFFPEPNMVFEQDCMQVITGFLGRLEAVRKQIIKDRKNGN